MLSQLPFFVFLFAAFGFNIILAGALQEQRIPLTIKVPAAIKDFVVLLSSHQVPFPKNLVIPDVVLAEAVEDEVSSEFPSTYRKTQDKTSHSEGSLQIEDKLMFREEDSSLQGEQIDIALLRWVQENQQDIHRLCNSSNVPIDLEQVQLLGFICSVSKIMTTKTIRRLLGEKEALVQLRGSSVEEEDRSDLALLELLQAIRCDQNQQFHHIVEMRSLENETLFHINSTRHLRSSRDSKNSQRLEVENELRTGNDASEALSNEASRAVQAIASLIGNLNASSGLPHNFSFQLATDVPLIFVAYVYNSSDVNGNDHWDPIALREEEQERLNEALLSRLVRLNELNEALEIFAGKQPFVPNDEESDLLHYVVNALKNQNSSFTHMKGRPPVLSSLIPTVNQLALEEVLLESDSNSFQNGLREKPFSMKNVNGLRGSGYSRRRGSVLLGRIINETISFLDITSHEWNEDPNDGFFVSSFPLLHPLNALEIKAEDWIYFKSADLLFGSLRVGGDISHSIGLYDFIRGPFSPTVVFNRILPFFVEAAIKAAPIIPFGESVATAAHDELGSTMQSSTSFLSSLFWNDKSEYKVVPKSQTIVSFNLPADFNSRTNDGHYIPPLNWELPDRVASQQRSMSKERKSMLDLMLGVGRNIMLSQNQYSS